MVNAMLAAKDETIAAKDETIASLKAQLKAMAKELAAKDESIALLRQRLSDYHDHTQILFTTMVSDNKDFDEVK